MIGSLRGEVLERDGEAQVLLEVGGVGYLVHVTPRTASELAPGRTAFLYVHHQVREDAQTLFGFTTRAECSTFRTLIGTHGVGPALALAVLGTHAPGALVEIVAHGDVAALTLVPGVGKKTAERLVVELRSRLSLPVLDDEVGAATSGRGSLVSDVRDALDGLGYGTDEIRETLRALDAADHADAAAMLRAALTMLGNRRA